MAAGKPTIGYVLALAVADSVFMGGVMVTDANGMPQEFRYTEPVRATKIQRVLYGDVLEKYILCDVIAGNLIGRLEHKPDLLITSAEVLLSTLEATGKRSVMLLASRVPALKEYGAQQDVTDSEFFLQLTENGSPIRVHLPSLGVTVDAAKRAEVIRTLQEVGKTMDVLEPISRLETAVKMLWEEVPETPVA